MRVSWSLRRWLHLPSRVALLLGLGAISAAGAHADAGMDRPGAGIAPLAQGEQANAGELVIRAEAGRLYLSEAGGQFQELRLGDMPEALVLRQLLERNGAAVGASGIGLGPMILAGSGGDGFHWPAGGRSATGGQPGPAGASTPAAGTPAPAAPPQQPGPPGNAATGPAGKKG